MPHCIMWDRDSSTENKAVKYTVPITRITRKSAAA